MDIFFLGNTSEHLDYAMLQSILLVVAVAQLCRGFYLPGVAVKSFGVGEEVELKVNKLSSVSAVNRVAYFPVLSFLESNTWRI